MRFSLPAHLGFSFRYTQPVLEPYLVTFPAQITGLELQRDYLDHENMGTHYIDGLAKEISVLSHGWNPLGLSRG